MRVLSILCVALLLVCSAQCWTRERDAHPKEIMQITIAVKQQNLDSLEEILLTVSDPESKNYGNYLSHKRVNELVAPTKESVSVVLQWLASSGIPDSRISHSSNSDFLSVRCTVEEVGHLVHLPSRIGLYSNSIGDSILRFEGSFVLPRHVAPHVDFVRGINSFPRRFERDETPVEATGNAPVVLRVYPGDKMLSTFFLPVCSDGSTTSSDDLCSDHTPAIQYTYVRLTQYGDERYYGFNQEQLTCQPCSKWTGSQGSVCASNNKKMSLSDSTMYCSTPVITRFDNYIQIDFAQGVAYSDNSMSDVASYDTPLFLGKWVTPQSLMEAYELDMLYVVSELMQNSQSVAEFLGQYYSPSDLTDFFTAVSAVPAEVVVNGPNDASQPGGEASLDIQYIMGIAQNVTTTFWSLGNLHEGQEPFLEWIIEVLNDSNAPLVHSISYGDDENTLEIEYMQRINVEFQKAGVRGISLFFSSGDSGVNSADPSNSDDCTVNGSFTPSFPASSPYVTAIGGTQFSTQTSPVCDMAVSGLPASCDAVGEIMSSIETGSRITSGGGFSNVFAMPSYQSAVVQEYLKGSGIAGIPSAYFNASGRAYPDVSACARNFLVVIDGELNGIDGTSAAAPTFAALATLWNEQLLKLNRSPLGFMNPLLYSLGRSAPNQYFRDIVMGNNRCGEDINSCCPYGFGATLGWDAVTGFGTPRFAGILGAVFQSGKRALHRDEL